ncbi:MAG TPA: helix-turn-helix domain-containing protein, partial [Thermoanaerobaculia bacterium]
VPRLAHHFLARACRVHGRQARLAADAVRWLRAQPWPGNVRELEQTVQRAVLILDRPEIRARDLEGLVRLRPAAAAPAGGADLPPPGAMTLDEIERAMIEKALARFDGHVTRAADALGVTRQTLYRRMEKHGLAGDG